VTPNPDIIFKAQEMQVVR